MSTGIFNSKSSPVPNKRRAPTLSEQNNPTSQPMRKKRSLSDRLRNIFRQDSSSKSRSSSKEQVQVVSGGTLISSESPRLRPPLVNWSIGKNSKPNSSSISRSNKRKNEQITSTNISNPINYRFDDRSEIYGGNLKMQTPQITRENNENALVLSNHEGYASRTNSSYQDRIFIENHTQQVNPNNSDVRRPTSHISEGSDLSPMNKMRSSNYKSDYYFYNERPDADLRMPLSDIEVLPTPERQRRPEAFLTRSNSEYLATKPPIIPVNDTQILGITQSSTSRTDIVQNRSASSANLSGDARSITSSIKDSETPKLNTPSLMFGRHLNKKQDKQKKSKSRSNATTNSISTIGQMVEQNPLADKRSSATIYGSLPDAEILYTGKPYSGKPPKKTTNKYPWLSAIVEHHMHPNSDRLPRNTTANVPTTTTSTATPILRPNRFDTSTETYEANGHNNNWLISRGNAATTSPTNRLYPDGLIRPVSPGENQIFSNIGLIRVGLNISAGEPYHGQYRSDQSEESPAVYRSSTTIYTRDRNQFVDHVSGGENNTAIRTPGKMETKHDQQVPPQPINNNINKTTRVTSNMIPIDYPASDDEEEIHEENYEVSYEYEREIEQFSYEGRKNVDDSKINVVYNNGTDGSQIRSEQEKIYHRAPQSFSNYCTTESYNISTSDHGAKNKVSHTYTLKRSDDYDGLGILIATDAQTRSLHFIREVEIGSPGHRAGLRKNDRIISVNNVNVENMDFSDVLMLIKEGIEKNNLQISVIHELD